MFMELPFEITKMFWNYIVLMVAQHFECTKATQFTFKIIKCLVLWYVNFISIKKKLKKIVLKAFSTYIHVSFPAK